ncbi:unnamed protein product [Lampetra fluviatilis]
MFLFVLPTPPPPPRIAPQLWPPASRGGRSSQNEVGLKITRAASNSRWGRGREASFAPESRFSRDLEALSPLARRKRGQGVEEECAGGTPRVIHARAIHGPLHNEPNKGVVVMVVVMGGDSGSSRPPDRCQRMTREEATSRSIPLVFFVVGVQRGSS